MRPGSSSRLHGPRTSIYDKIIEAGWLAAVVATPLFFNSFSLRSFEPDKTALLRSIALVMVVAWIVKFLDESSRQRSLTAGLSALFKGRVESVVLLCAVLLLLDHGLATAVSISPSLSLWGSYERLQGLYTWSAYFVVFLSIVTLLRTREQLERVVTALLMASCPVALYGLIQHHGLDPVVWAELGRRTVLSTMGNAIFLAGFLIMAVPMTLYRLVAAATELAGQRRPLQQYLVSAGCAVSVFASAVAWWGSVTGGMLAIAVTTACWLGLGLVLRGPLRSCVALAVYSVLLSMQLTAALLSESRGPFLGLLTAIFLFALLWATARRKWTLNLWFGGSAVVAVLALVSINLPHSPVGFVKELPVIGRLSSVLETSSTARVRLLLWEQSLAAISEEPVRTIVGYGPETVRLVLAPHYLPQLGTVENRDALPDRAHNATYDILITTGLVGLVLYYTFILAIFWLGLRRLGAITSGRSAGVFLAACIGSGLALSLFARLVDRSWRLLGICLPLGLLLGVAGYLTAHALRKSRLPRHEASPEECSDVTLLIIALLAGIAGHLVEIHVGIATVSTQAYFWTFAALCLCASWMLQPEAAETPARLHDPDGAATADQEAGSRWRREFNAGLAIVCLIIFTLSFDFVATGLSLHDNEGFAWVMSATCVMSGLLLLVHAWPIHRPAAWGFALIEFVGLYGSACLASLLLAGLIYNPTPGDHLDFHPAVIAYFITVLLFIGAITMSLGPRFGPAPNPRGGLRSLVYPVLLGGALVLIWTTNLKDLQADILFKRGWVAITYQGNVDRAIELERRALQLAPAQDHYFADLSNALAKKAAASREPELRDALFAEAEAGLLEGRRLSPDDPDHAANLARLYKKWAILTADRATRFERLRTSIGHYQDTLELSSGRPKLWNEYGDALARMEMDDQALANYEHSLSLDPSYLQTYLLLIKGYVGAMNWERARAVLEQALRQFEPSAALHMQLGVVNENLNRFNDAVRQYEAVVRIHPAHLKGNRSLILLHKRMGNCAAVVKQSRKMRAFLPEDSIFTPWARNMTGNCIQRELERSPDRDPRQGQELAH